MAPRFDDAPWRRMAMQAILAAALGLTVLMAYGVQRRQFWAQQVQLSPPAVYSFMGHRLSVRLPSGWTVVRRRDPEAQQAMVEAIETTSPFGIHRRLQLVVQFDAGETATAEEVSVKYHEGHSASIVRPYQFAGSPGVWMEFPLEAADPSSGRDWQPPEVCVSAVPKSQHDAILLNFGGMQTLTTTDIALFGQVAATVSLVDGANATPTTTEPVDRPRLRELQPSEHPSEND